MKNEINIISPSVEDIKKLEKEHLEGDLSYLSDLEGVICYDYNYEVIKEEEMKNETFEEQVKNLKRAMKGIYLITVEDVADDINEKINTVMISYQQKITSLEKDREWLHSQILEMNIKNNVLESQLKEAREEVARLKVGLNHCGGQDEIIEDLEKENQSLREELKKESRLVDSIIFKMFDKKVRSVEALKDIVDSVRQRQEERLETESIKDTNADKVGRGEV